MIENNYKIMKKKKERSKNQYSNKTKKVKLIWRLYP